MHAPIRALALLHGFVLVKSDPVQAARIAAYDSHLSVVDWIHFSSPADGRPNASVTSRSRIARTYALLQLFRVLERSQQDNGNPPMAVRSRKQLLLWFHIPSSPEQTPSFTLGSFSVNAFDASYVQPGTTIASRKRIAETQRWRAGSP